MRFHGSNTHCFHPHLQQEQDFDQNQTEADLYNDGVAPSIDSKEENGTDREHSRSDADQSTSTDPNNLSQSKKISLYIGNLTWWTSDADITDAISNLGVTDVSDIKFFENRANGQSKGFCVISLSSETSVRNVLEKLPKVEIQGQNPVVTPCNRQSLNHFEMQSRKQTPPAPGQPAGMNNAPRPAFTPGMNSVSPGMRPPLIGRQPLPRPNGPLLGQPSRPPLQAPSYSSAPSQSWGQGMPPRGPPIQTQAAPRPMRPLMPLPPHASRPPGPGGHGGPLLRTPGPPLDHRPHHQEWSDHSSASSGYGMQPMSSRAGPPQGVHPSGGPNNVHLNPAFIQGQSGPSGDYGRSHPGYMSTGDYRHPGSGDLTPTPLSEAEAEEIMNKNRTISSSSIQRAISDAARGKYFSHENFLFALI